MGQLTDKDLRTFPVSLTIADRLLTAEELAAIARWRYESPFDFYDGNDDGNEVLLQRDDDGRGYFPVEDEGTFVGYVCFGPEGRVAGQDDVPGVCDLGIGLDPRWLDEASAVPWCPR